MKLGKPKDSGWEDWGRVGESPPGTLKNPMNFHFLGGRMDGTNKLPHNFFFGGGAEGMAAKMGKKPSSYK